MSEYDDMGIFDDYEFCDSDPNDYYRDDEPDDIDTDFGYDPYAGGPEMDDPPDNDYYWEIDSE